MVEKMQYVMLPAKHRTVSNTAKVSAEVLPAPKRHFVKVNESDFVNEIKRRPILYNYMHPEYKRISVRNDAWVQVALAMNLSEQECKKRWRSMRDAFHKTIRTKNEEERKSWIHYRLLEFMLPYIRKGEYGSLNDCGQCNGDEEDIDYLGIDSGEELYEGPVTVSYMTQDGKQLYQVTNVPWEIGRTIIEEETEEELEDIDPDGTLDVAQPQYSPSHEYLLSTATDDEAAEHETVVYEEQLDSSMQHIERTEFQPEWSEESELSTKERLLPEEEIRSVCKRPRIEAIEEHDVRENSFGAVELEERLSEVAPPIAGSEQPTALPSIAIVPPVQPQREEHKESDARLGITDPDERFLLSCAPILRRLSNKKNQMARLKIQQVLYEVEYGEKYPYEST
ncbi:uncharacterized protein LOC128727877 [Anopheles nili]|uniref:uncharacterized protein LOC128727877 n=1 Tax=Anopheles nili TaxID=185578 RepID=UPI00237AD41C|nr:uncharacterized protein LOC128727877 [Anopheles nili]